MSTVEKYKAITADNTAYMFIAGMVNSLELDRSVQAQNQLFSYDTALEYYTRTVDDIEIRHPEHGDLMDMRITDVHDLLLAMACDLDVPSDVIVTHLADSGLVATIDRATDRIGFTLETKKGTISGWKSVGSRT